jgi:hypothetical protein
MPLFLKGFHLNKTSWIMELRFAAGRQLPYTVALMTKLLDQAVAAAQSASPETQDDVARMILTYFGREQTPVELSPEDEAAVMKARGAVARGEIATDARMRAIWAKYAL